jgi:hypothetical protein
VIAHGELGRQVNLMSSSAMSAGRIARGRSLLHLVFSYYASGATADLMYDIHHLHRITLNGYHIVSFQNKCIMVLSELEKTPDPEVIQHGYHKRAQRLKPLA